MRVMHVVADLGTYGAERFVVQLLDRLQATPIEVAALTIAPSRESEAPSSIVRFSAGRRGRYDFAFLARMTAAIRSWRPDIVHTHTHAGKYWGRLAAILAGVPAIVHTEHNSEFGAPAPFRLLNRALRRRTAAYVTFSSAQRDRLVAEERVDPARVAIIPNGVPIAPLDSNARQNARAALGVAGEDSLLLHVGRLSAVKNQRLAIEALAHLDGARLALAGEGKERAALQRLARERGVADRVTFLGYRPDAAQLVAGADLALVTSRNEAMPLAVIEALLAATPVVSTPWTGATEMIGAFGVVTADYDAANFAQAIRGVLADRATACARAAEGQRFARREYDIATTADRYAALYRAIAASSCATSPAITAPRS